MSAPPVTAILRDAITALAAEHWPSRPAAPAVTAADVVTPTATPESTPVKKTSGKKTPSKSSGKKSKQKAEPEAEAEEPAAAAAVQVAAVPQSTFSNDLVVRIFKTEMCASNSKGRVQLLELSCYLEHYLWPHLGAAPSMEHTLSILLLLNEKCREGVAAFDALTADADKFELFFKAVVSLWMESSHSLSGVQKANYIQFLVHVYLSLENAVIRRCCLQYLSLPLWSALSADRLSIELEAFPPLKKHWQHLIKEKAGGSKSAAAADSAVEAEAPSSGKKRGRQSGGGGSATKAAKKKANAAASAAASAQPDQAAGASTLAEEWVPRLVTDFLAVIEGGAEGAAENRLYVERFLEFILDLLSQLPTRRFLNAFLDDIHFVVRLRRAAGWSAMPLVSRLTNAVDDLTRFEIQDQTGRALTRSDVMAAHWARLHTVQEVAHHFKKDLLRDLIFSSTGELGKEDVLRKHLSLLDPEALFDFAVQCHLLSHRDLAQGASLDFALSVIVEKLTHRRSQLDALNQSPLYPTERELWDQDILPAGGFKFTGDAVLALPKLNLQFLTMHDYLLRNYTLFKLESSYEIRQDLVDAVKRMAPKQASPSGPVTFGGWARMAMPLAAFKLTLISKPSIGDVFPREVRAVVELDLSRFKGDIRSEWEQLREHDVVFLLAIQSPRPSASSSAAAEFGAERRELAAGRKPRSSRVSDAAGASRSSEENEFDFPAEYGVSYVRGAEVIEVRDEDDVVLNDFTK
jgi:intron-binding protein aquarius